MKLGDLVDTYIKRGYSGNMCTRNLTCISRSRSVPNSVKVKSLVVICQSVIAIEVHLDLNEVLPVALEFNALYTLICYYNTNS